ncbi:hypothetical protein GCM10009107_14620 [Ideonella azotifigens]|uniref:Lipoprotein n=1 Tax=Ideonella azotifigens TaxID=513160 RepID=A0ABN1JU73_9BURK
MRKLVFAGLILLTGCATQWVKPGASPETLAVDTGTCKAQAENTLPPKLVTVNGGWATPPRRECTGGAEKVSCTSIPGVPAAPRLVDENEQARQKATDVCLRNMGWTKG